jgi:hypothetical protein
MSTIKTHQTNQNVFVFIEAFVNSEQKKNESHELIKIMQEFTGFEPKMWGPSIIGFGVYHYKSAKSRQEGDWPLLGFSPRKAAISLYIYSGLEEHAYLLEKLGKFKMGKACIYVKKLSDIDIEVMKRLMKASIEHLQKTYGEN